VKSIYCLLVTLIIAIMSNVTFEFQSLIKKNYKKPSLSRQIHLQQTLSRPGELLSAKHASNPCGDILGRLVKPHNISMYMYDLYSTLSIGIQLMARVFSL